MQPYRYALSITSQFYFCGIPFRLDSSPKCSLNCLYCFAMARGGRRTSTNLIANTEAIHRKFIRTAHTEAEQLDPVGSFIRAKVPVHFGGMSDPFSNTAVTKTSIELLKTLAEFDYPTVISTKSTKKILNSTIIEHLKKLKHLIIQISIPTSNNGIASILEPNIPSPSERIKAIQILSSEGFNVFVRLQPLLPSYTKIEAYELIPQVAEAGAKHVVIEFLKLPVERNISMVTDMFNELHWDGFAYYHKYQSIRTGREWVLPPELKWEELQPMISEIHKYGMTYGAGDYGLNHLSDTDSCCGIDSIPGFSQWFHANIPYIIKKSNAALITFDELDKFETTPASIRMYMNSHCREEGAHTIKDFLKLKWNRPGTENAPDTFLGVSSTGELDDNRNLVYKKESL